MDVLLLLTIPFILNSSIVADYFVFKLLTKKYQFSFGFLLKIFFITLLIWGFIGNLLGLDVGISYFSKPPQLKPGSMINLVLMIPFMNVIPAVIQTFIILKLNKSSIKLQSKNLFILAFVSRNIAAYLLLAFILLMANIS